MNSKSLTLSIVIPVHNEEYYLKSCLESLENQVEPLDQVIVVDNNSSDKSVQIARSFPFVTVLHEPVQGIVHARNRGFNYANSDLIGRIDADTVLDANWAAHVRRRAVGLQEFDGVTGPCGFYDAKFPRLMLGFHRVIYFWSSRLLFGHTVLFGSNMFIRRSAWEKLRQDTCLDNALHEDMDLASHVFKYGGNLYFDPGLLAKISSRRFHNWGKYPGMWLRTWTTHGSLIPARYQAVRNVNDAGEY